MTLLQKIGKNPGRFQNITIWSDRYTNVKFEHGYWDTVLKVGDFKITRKLLEKNQFAPCFANLVFVTKLKPSELQVLVYIIVSNMSKDQFLEIAKGTNPCSSAGSTGSTSSSSKKKSVSGSTDCQYCTGKGKKGDVLGCTSTQCKACNYVIPAHKATKPSPSPSTYNGKNVVSNDISYNGKAYVVLGDKKGKLYCRIKSSIK